jgi:hypothetical protein
MLAKTARDHFVLFQDLDAEHIRKCECRSRAPAAAPCLAKKKKKKKKKQKKKFDN